MNFNLCKQKQEVSYVQASPPAQKCAYLVLIHSLRSLRLCESQLVLFRTSKPDHGQDACLPVAGWGADVLGSRGSFVYREDSLQLCSYAETMIEVDGLTKFYGPLTAVSDVSFRVEKGEVVGFLGPNGAGKTTTMRIVTGFCPPSRGSARLAGYDVQKSPIEVKKRVGYLPETVPLYPEMVVSRFLSYVAEVKGVPRDRRRSEVWRVIERCGVQPVASRLVRNISKGFRQRVGLAQALIGNPPILVLDEPTVGLDPSQIVEIRNMIRGLAEEHTVLLSTHILPEVAMVCERVIIIHEGRVAVEDTMENLAGGNERQRIEVRAEGLPEKVLETLEGIPGANVSYDAASDTFCVDAPAQPPPVDAVARALIHKGITIKSLNKPTQTLEEVFLKVIAGEDRSTR